MITGLQPHANERVGNRRLSSTMVNTNPCDPFITFMPAYTLNPLGQDRILTVFRPQRPQLEKIMQGVESRTRPPVQSHPTEQSSFLSVRFTTRAIN